MPSLVLSSSSSSTSLLLLLLSFLLLLLFLLHHFPHSLGNAFSFLSRPASCARHSGINLSTFLFVLQSHNDRIAGIVFIGARQLIAPTTRDTKCKRDWIINHVLSLYLYIHIQIYTLRYIFYIYTHMYICNVWLILHVIAFENRRKSQRICADMQVVGYIT